MGEQVRRCTRCGAELRSDSDTCAACREDAAATDPDLSDLLIGRDLANKYEVLSLIGRGGMGSVYLAQQLALKRRVALKVLHPSLASQELLVQRFLREARASSSLSHPNIVTVLDFGQEPQDGLLYLVMEYLEGRTLAEMIQDGPLPPQELLRISRHVLLALDEAHAQGIVHRDLKPDNIIVVPSRQGPIAKVLDFGLARVMEGEGPRLTTTGLICGTPAYISPEQARGDEAGPLCDIYSFGVVLFEVLTGKPPFEGASPWVLVSKHLHEPPPDPAVVAPERAIPRELSDIIRRCLAKQPADRFPSAMALCDALTECLSEPAGLPATRVQTGPVRQEAKTMPQPPPPPGDRRKCEHCGATMPSSAKFCGSCGISFTRRCSCGKAVRHGQRRCDSCGASLVPTPSASRIPSREQGPQPAGTGPQAKLPEPRLSPSHSAPRGISAGFPAELTDPRTLASGMVGRAREQQLLEKAARRTLAGRGAALLMRGEAGSGKTTLLYQFAAALKRMGLQVHLIRFEPHAPIAAGLAAGARSFLGGASEQEQRAKLAALNGASLDAADRALLAHLAFGAPAPLPGLNADALGVALATALRRLVCLRASSHPTALLFDDLRHLSARDRMLIDVLAGCTPDGALLVVATELGTDDLPAVPPAPWTTIHLGPLDRSESDRLLRKLVGDRLHPETARRIVEQGLGNPLYLVETARMLQDMGVLAERGSHDPHDDAPEVQVPEGLRGLIISRFEALDASAGRVLSYAAALRGGFTEELLGSLLRDAQGVSSILEGLCRQGLLEAEPLGNGRESGPSGEAKAAGGQLAKGPGAKAARLRFCHEMVREVIYKMVPAKALRAMHEEIATLLASRGSAESEPETLADHLARADRNLEAASLFERAADSFTRRQEHRDAAALLGSAVAALRRAQGGSTSPANTSSRLASLHIKRAEALNRAASFDDAKAAALEARNLALKMGDVLHGARAARELARAALAQGSLAHAEGLLGEAYQVALACGDLDLAFDLASDLGDARERAGQLAEARGTLVEVYRRLEEAARRGGQVPSTQRAEALNRLGRVSLRARRVAEAIAYLESALAEASAAGDPSLRVRVLRNLGNARAAAGQTDVAAELLDKALTDTRKNGDRRATAELLHDLAALRLQAGERAQAETLARESYGLSVEIGWREGQSAGATLLEQLHSS